MFDSMFSLFINAVETFTIVYFTFNYLMTNKKFNKKYFILLWILLFLEVSFFNSLGVPYVVETGTQILTLAVFTYFLSQDTIVIKLFIPVFSYVLLYISNMITLFSTSFFMNVPIENLSKEKYFYIVIIISKIVFAFLGGLIAEFRRKRRVIIEVKRNWILLVPLIIMLWILSVNLLELILRGVMNYKLLYLSIIVLMIFCILLYFLFEFILRDSENRTHELMVIQQLKYQRENMEDIKELNEEMRKIKHDLKHQLSYIVEGLKDQKVDEMIKILETSYKEIDKTNIISFSDNETLNYILQSKNKFAMQKGVKLRCEITYENSSIMKDEDLIILLGNLLDNSVENTYEGGEVLLKITKDKGLLHIKISNPVLIDEVDTSVTSKQDKRNHGFGMKSIYKIIDKYDGSLEKQVRDGVFLIDILMNC
ncbi:MAG: GHKL domain-containing protein [Erysipelotrichaceae bacterium]|jgi:two-component system sensor histidine kinase AgrC|nr:GHKL domain-containing protein [Erysipelotrichaceae bacterium]